MPLVESSLAEFVMCSACGVARVQREPHLSETCSCGRPWMPARRATNADWQTRLVIRALDRALYANPPGPAGQWSGLSPAGERLCERVRDMACCDRWYRGTRLYAAATALLNAHINHVRAGRTDSRAQFARSRKALLAGLTEFQHIKRAVGIA